MDFNCNQGISEYKIVDLQGDPTLYYLQSVTWEIKGLQFLINRFLEKPETVQNNTKLDEWKDELQVKIKEEQMIMQEILRSSLTEKEYNSNKNYQIYIDYILLFYKYIIFLGNKVNSKYNILYINKLEEKHC